MPVIISPYSLFSGVTFVASATSTSSGIVIPATAQVGDLAYLVDVGDEVAGGSAPAGWTTVITTNYTGAYCVHSLKILTSGEPGSTVTGMNGTDGNWKVCLVFRPSSSVSNVAISSYNGEGSTGNPSTQNVTVVGQTTPVIVIASTFSNNGFPAFVTETPAFSQTITQSRQVVGFTIYNESPQNHAVDMGDPGTQNIIQSGYIRLEF